MRWKRGQWLCWPASLFRFTCTGFRPQTWTFHLSSSLTGVTSCCWRAKLWIRCFNLLVQKCYENDPRRWGRRMCNLASSSKATRGQEVNTGPLVTPVLVLWNPPVHCKFLHAIPKYWNSIWGQNLSCSDTKVKTPFKFYKEKLEMKLKTNQELYPGSCYIQSI